MGNQTSARIPQPIQPYLGPCLGFRIWVRATGLRGGLVMRVPEVTIWFYKELCGSLLSY